MTIKGMLYGEAGTFVMKWLASRHPSLTRSPLFFLHTSVTPGTDPLPELVAQLAQETYQTDLLLHLIQNIAKFDFEARKDVAQIFNNMLRRQIGSRWPTVEYLCGKPDIMFATLKG